MNKIYKVIWSKVRCCYVVVSELAKANGKSAAVRAVKAAPLAALVAAAVVTGSCYMPQPVLASEEIGNTDIVVEGSVTNIQKTVDAGSIAQVNDAVAKNVKPKDSIIFGVEEGDNIEVTYDGGLFTVSTKQEVDFNKVTVGGVVISNDNGINAGGNKVTNVADGEVSADSKDAVNGSQLHAVDQKVDNINQSIDNVNSRVNKLDGRINKVGAGAAALAALHPLDFDPDNKLTFSAGMGNYRGENAAALGMFYRPDEKMMLSLGGTVGNGENMVNMGVSFALDRTSTVTNSKVAMAREIVELREQVTQLILLVNQLAASQGAGSVAAPAAYNRVRVDRISGDDNAANKIERVRVNTGDDKDSYGSKITPVSAAK